MNSRSFRRKVIYLVIMAALLYPLSQLSQPATTGPDGKPGRPGGTLAQLRNQYKLGQVNLGKIDPVSETLKLATFGMRGIAATVLWNKTDEYKEKKDWISLQATLEQIKNLQPNYIGVWQFQAHNVGYNISAEWDDYRDRYYWVIRGIEFLQDGIDYNQNEPKLLSDVGWFATNKIGQSDEKIYFRKLFAEDDDFHKKQHVHERDNWLFGIAYYNEAINVVENAIQNLESVAVPMSPWLLYMKPVLSSTLHCDAIELDHHQALTKESAKQHESPEIRAEKIAAIDQHFDDQLQNAWKNAYDLWKIYGKREFISSAGVRYRFDELDAKKQELKDTLDKLDQLEPGLSDKIRREKIEKLPEDQRVAFEIKQDDRTAVQSDLANMAEQAIEVLPHEVAERIAPAVREQAKKLADEAIDLKAVVMVNEYEREHPNYDYWLARCQMEQKAEAREARRLLHHADISFAEGDLVNARTAFEQAFELWHKVLGADPTREMLEDQTAFMINEKIDTYEQVLNQLDESFPKKFVLQDLRDVQSYGHGKP